MLRKLVSKISRRIDWGISGPAYAQLIFFVSAISLIFIIMFVISAAVYPTESSLTRRFWLLILNFMDFGGYDNTDGVAPHFIFFVNVLGVVFFSGLIVSLFVNFFEQRIEKVRRGKVRYDFENHILIIGFNMQTSGIVRKMLEKPKREIVLQTVQDANEVRSQLFSNLSETYTKRITIINGGRTSSEDIDKLNITKSREVFLLGEENETEHDSKNIESLGVIAEKLKTANKYLRIFVLFENEVTFTAFLQQDIPDIHNYIDFVPFNFCGVWAKRVFVDLNYNNGEVKYMPLDREPVSAESGKQIHLIILGMNDMGIALAIQAAHICHFPNFFTKGLKTRITFIDNEAQDKSAVLKCRLRNFFKMDFTDIEFKFLRERVEAEAAQAYIEEAARDKNMLLTIAAVDAADALAAVLCLPDAVYESDTQILVRQNQSYALVSLLSQKIPGVEYRKYRNLKPFGMFANAINIESADELLPMMIKYTYDNTSEANTVNVFDESAIRDNWRHNWKAGDNISALKSSNRCCADFIDVKVRSLGIESGVELTEEQIYYAALMEHQRWLTEKLLLGFRPPTPQEAAGIAAGKKRAYYKERFIHEDIKAYNDLGTDEKNVDVKSYDINISRAMPFMLKEYNRMVKL